VADISGVNWQAILSGAYQPDATTWQNWRWNESTVLNGNPTISDTWAGGSGILIVTGNLNITSSFWFWSGIILVGGNMTVSTSWSNSWMIGTVITGLNSTVSPVPLRTVLTEPSSSFGRLTIQYSSCAILNALQSETHRKHLDRQLGHVLAAAHPSSKPHTLRTRGPLGYIPTTSVRTQ
jgi:hypothetical protein